MDNNILVAIIAVIGVAITSICSIIAAVVSSRTKSVAQETHLLVNSRMDELLAKTRLLALAQGHAAGEQAQRDREP